MFVCACMQKAFVGDAFLFCPSQLFFCNINIKNEYLSAVQACVLWDRESGLSVWMRGGPGELIFDQMCFGFNSAAAFFSAALFA